MPLDVLLTGKPPFQPNEDGTKQITDMRALLKDDVPDEWLSDSNTQNHDVEDPGPVTSIEELLADVLQKFLLPSLGSQETVQGGEVRGS